jgi:hypothetical protein
MWSAPLIWHAQATPNVSAVGMIKELLEAWKNILRVQI